MIFLKKKNNSKTDHINIHSKSSGKYLKSWVYGGLDGIITTFAVVSGVIGAELNSKIILILGFANLIGDGISMGIGDYLSTKSENEYYLLERKREEKELKKNPIKEKEYVSEIYKKKGLNKKDASLITKILLKRRNLFLDTVIREELNLNYNNNSPIKNGLVTFISFFLFGIIPLFLFLLSTIFNFNLSYGFLLTAILSGISMFVLGLLKSKIIKKNWIVSGLETLFVGGIAASFAYFIGYILSRIL